MSGSRSCRPPRLGDAPAAAPAGDGDAAAPPRPTPQQRIARLQKDAGDKLTRRLGWMTRAHPVVLDGTRLIVPLYSDGFSFSLMAISRRLGRDLEDQHAAHRRRQHPAVDRAAEGWHAGHLHA